MHGEGKASSARRLSSEPTSTASEDMGDGICEARIARGPRKGERCTALSNPKGSRRCGRHRGKVSKVIRVHQPALDLPAPEVVEGDDGTAQEGEEDG